MINTNPENKITTLGQKGGQWKRGFRFVTVVIEVEGKVEMNVNVNVNVNGVRAC